jgi:hypothetical protein
MNNRIDELVEECTVIYRDGHGAYIDQLDTEKFAELIVRECCNIVRDEVQYINDFDTADSVVTEVKKYFGVE